MHGKNMKRPSPVFSAGSGSVFSFFWATCFGLFFKCFTCIGLEGDVFICLIFGDCDCFAAWCFSDVSMLSLAFSCSPTLRSLLTASVGPIFVQHYLNQDCDGNATSIDLDKSIQLISKYLEKWQLRSHTSWNLFYRRLWYPLNSFDILTIPNIDDRLKTMLGQFGADAIFHPPSRIKKTRVTINLQNPKSKL